MYKLYIAGKAILRGLIVQTKICIKCRARKQNEEGTIIEGFDDNRTIYLYNTCNIKVPHVQLIFVTVIKVYSHVVSPISYYLFVV